MLKFKLLLGLMLVFSAIWGQTPAITTEHGYRFYHHIKMGGQKPQRGETIKAFVNIFIGDTLVSSSRKNLGGPYKFDIAPADAQLDHYPPLMDAVLLMGLGDSATIFQSIDSSMLKFVPKGVKNAKELRFEIALVQIISAEEKAKMEQAFIARAAMIKEKAQNKVQEYASGALKGQLTTTPSGLKMLVEERGRGRQVAKGEAVQVHYYGFLTNGTIFDNSFDRRHALAFPVGIGQMIPGFDEGVLSLTHGSKAYLFIPSNLGYGNSEAAGGLIQPNSEIIFYIEVL